MRDQQRLRKLAAGVCMVVAPALVIVSWLLWPTLTSDGAAFMEETAALGRGRVTAGLVVGAFGVPFAVIAVMGLVHLLHDRKSPIGTIGAGLAIVGLTLFGAFIGVGIATVEIAFSGVAGAEKAVLAESILNSGAMLVVYAGVTLFAAGFLVLAGGLYAARAVPQPSAVLLGAFAMVYVAGNTLYSFPLVMASLVALAAALIPVGLEILFETDEQWEHPPTFDWYRLAGASA